MSKLLKATAYSGMSSLVNLVVQLTKSKLSAVLLGQVGMGIVSQVNYIWGFLNILAGLGLSGGLVKHTSEYNREDKQQDMLELQTSILLVGSVSSILVAVFGWLFREDLSILFIADATYKDLLGLALLALPCAVIGRYQLSILRGLRHIKEVARVNILANMVSLVLFVALILSLRVPGVIISFVLYQFLLLIIGFYVLRVTHISPLKLFRFSQFRWAMIVKNLPYGVAGLLMTASSSLTIMYISRQIIANMGMASNGVFAVTWKVSSLYLSILFSSATMYYYPTLAGLAGRKEVVKEMNDTLNVFIVVIAPAITLLICLHWFILPLLFSSDFALSGKLLAAHLPGDLFRVTGELLCLPLLARGYVKTYAMLYLVYCIQYVVQATYLMNDFGLYGVSMAYTGAYVCNAVLAAIAVCVAFKYRPTKSLLFIVPGAVLMIGLASWTSREPVIGPIAGIASVALWAFLFRNHEAATFVKRNVLKRIKRS